MERSQGKRIALALGLSASVSIFASACNGGSLDLRGRFQGIQFASARTKPVVAQLPGFQSSGKTSSLGFKVFETLASAKGEDVSISFGKGPELQLSVSAGLPSPVTLKKSGDCADGEAGQVAVHLCWTAEKLDLDAKDSAGIVVYSLHLQKDGGLPELPNANSNEPFSVDQIVGRAKFFSYSVSEEAERTYQAKAEIGVAQGALLPHLNLRSLFGLASGERSAIFETIGNVLPFLFPSNWYRWEQTKELYRAEKASYAGLRGNEMNVAEGLYYTVVRDQLGLALVKQHLAWLQSVQVALKQEELAGTVPTGTAEYFGVAVARLDQDRIAYENYLAGGLASLAQGVALSPNPGSFSLRPTELPDLSAVAMVSATEFQGAAQSRAPEIATLQSLLKAAQLDTKETTFAWLDPSGNQSLNFGLGSQISIGKSHQAEIQERLIETTSLVTKRSVNVAYEYNSAISTYRVSAGAVKAVQNRITWLMQRHLGGDAGLGETEFVEQLNDLQGQLLGFKEDLLSAQHDWLIAKSKLDRLLLTGFYAGLGDGVPGEPGAQSPPQH